MHKQSPISCSWGNHCSRKGRSFLCCYYSSWAGGPQWPYCVAPPFLQGEGEETSNGTVWKWAYQPRSINHTLLCMQAPVNWDLCHFSIQQNCTGCCSFPPCICRGGYMICPYWRWSHSGLDMTGTFWHSVKWEGAVYGKELYTYISKGEQFILHLPYKKLCSWL